MNLANLRPAVTAAEIAMVDTMLAGRFILGIGPGGLRSDAEMMETLDADLNAIFLEAIHTMIALWTRQPPYRLLGKRWNLTTERTAQLDIGMGALLRPFQKPYPPIVVTAILPHSNGITAAAERGWAPAFGELRPSLGGEDALAEVRRGCARAGREGAWRGLARREKHLRRRRRCDGAMLRGTFGHYFRNLLRKGQGSRGTTLFKHDPSVADEAVTDDYLAAQMLICGTPNEVADRLRAFRDHGPFGRLLYCGHDWGGDAKAMRRSMELMAQKVLPAIVRRCAARCFSVIAKWRYASSRTRRRGRARS